jgi:hypothetical protein
MREHQACQQTKKVMHACTGGCEKDASGCLLSAHCVKPCGLVEAPMNPESVNPTGEV